MSNSVDLIDTGLYLGDKNAATNLNLIAKLGISHILSVDLIPLPQVVTSSFPNLALMQVSVADMCEEDLLSYFETSIRFIREGVESAGVLVHCYHGVSRSATIVMAYLMKTRKWPLSITVDEVKSKRPCVTPNSGFMDQLRLYEAMKCKLDKSFLPFKLYKLSHIHQQVLKAKILPAFVKVGLQKSPLHEENLRPGSFTSISEGSSGSESNNSRGISTIYTTIYKCKKCRFHLASQENVLPHWPSEATTTWTLLLEQGSPGNACKSGIFIEPLKWMDVCGPLAKNRLSCGKCGSKLGSYAWDCTVKCACGGQMAPGFHINLSKVDKCTMHKEVEAVI